MNAMANWPPPTSWLPETYVYAYLDADENILYIGQSYDLSTRHGAHRINADWFEMATDFALISIHHNRRHALDAEAQAIRDHRPLFNVVHHPDRKRVFALASST